MAEGSRSLSYSLAMYVLLNTICNKLSSGPVSKWHITAHVLTATSFPKHSQLVHAAGNTVAIEQRGQSHTSV